MKRKHIAYGLGSALIVVAALVAAAGVSGRLPIGLVAPAAWAANQDHDHEAHDHEEAVHEAEEHRDEDDHSGHDHAAGEHEAEAAEEHAGEHQGEHEDEHEDEGGDGPAHEGEGLRLTAEQRERFGVVVRRAGGGSLSNEVSLPGEIVFNEDRVVHMVPRVAGIVREVHKAVGDRVKAGEVLAVIESRELADAKAEYMAARARAGLAEKNHRRVKVLHEQQVSSEQDFLEAELAFAEARIELRKAEQKLHALGLTEAAIGALDHEHDETITFYEIVAPIDGVVTDKHISLGESLEANTDIFTVADLGSVWVNLTVYMKNLSAARVGQEVTLRLDHSGARARGVVSMVTPFVEADTRSATARVVLDNGDGRWVPGTFVTGFIGVSRRDLPVVAPREAVQNIEGRDVVFVEHDGAFEPRPVVVGRADRSSVEIVSGLDPGTPYATRGAFQLKATVITSNLGSHAGHGH